MQLAVLEQIAVVVSGVDRGVHALLVVLPLGRQLLLWRARLERGHVLAPLLLRRVVPFSKSRRRNLPV